MRRCGIVVAIVAVLMAVAISDTQNEIGVVDAKVLNVRSCASTSCAKVGQLSEGDEVIIIDTLVEAGKEWYEIEFDNDIGYTAGWLVTVLPPSHECEERSLSEIVESSYLNPFAMCEYGWSDTYLAAVIQEYGIYEGKLGNFLPNRASKGHDYLRLVVGFHCSPDATEPCPVNAIFGWSLQGYDEYSTDFSLNEAVGSVRPSDTRFAEIYYEISEDEVLDELLWVYQPGNFSMGTAYFSLAMREDEDESPLIPTPDLKPTAMSTPTQAPSQPAQYTCTVVKTCDQMANCLEAFWRVLNCGHTDLDSNEDGIPCENVCKK